MTFPNLARSEPFEQSTIDEVTSVCRAELEAAGIHTYVLPSSLSPRRGEVPTGVIGSLSKWMFERAWYYWRAEGPGIPPDVANFLHQQHGKDCRVAGHCGCPSPREWYSGFAVGNYHVDTPEALKALADVIRSIDPIGSAKAPT